MHIFCDNCNEYYCIYCEKKHSHNVKHIEDHYNSMFHARYFKLQQKTQYFKQLSIGNYKFKLSFFCRYLYKCWCVVFLPLFFVAPIVEWGVGRHYMIYKKNYVFIPTCFERIKKHIARPKHGQNLLKHQSNNVNM
jgi:hypothetical protein